MDSDWRHSFVDLTQDSDSDEDAEGFLPALSGTGSLPSRSSVAIPISSGPSSSTHAGVTQLPLPRSASRNAPPSATLPALHDHTPSVSTFTAASRRPSGVVDGTGPRNYVPTSNNASDGMSTSEGLERATKRMRLSISRGGGGEGPSASAQLMSSTANAACQGETRSEHQEIHDRRDGRKGSTAQLQNTSVHTASTPQNIQKAPSVPSVQYMNEALKANDTSIPLLDQVSTGRPRTLQISRLPQEIETTSRHTQRPTKSIPSVAPVANKQSRLDSRVRPELAQDTHPQTTHSVWTPGSASRASANTQAQPWGRAIDLTIDSPEPPRDDNKDRNLPVDTSESTTATQRIAAHPPHPQLSPLPLPRPAPTLQARTEVPKQEPVHKKPASYFTQEQDHFLIFLKEVRRLKWQEITKEFNLDFPGRSYAILQARYSTKLNKRDRSQDPASLTLPARYGSHVAVDWQSVHANNRGPRERSELDGPGRDIAFGSHHSRQALARPKPIRQTIEQDYSSGTDSAPRRERTRRAKPVNYTWPKNHYEAKGDHQEEPEDDAAGLESWTDNDVNMRSETPPEDMLPVTGPTVAINSTPMNTEFNVDDAKLALITRRAAFGYRTEQLPYLAVEQRVLAQQPPVDWNWEQLSSRDWQGSLLHVDFSPDELQIVCQEVFRICTRVPNLRHSTRRRTLRHYLRNLTEPLSLEITSCLQRRLPSRSKSSIMAFLQDAATGHISEIPHAQRLVPARLDYSMSNVQRQSTLSIIRQRELGRQSTRGWQAAAKPLAYPIKNKYMDSLGPACAWTGASSDIHAVAWAPNGECFAAAAVAVDDPDSMQYNRPNNLLYGHASQRRIRELGEHFKKRHKTEKGANSTHAMFVSQDPKVYNTVSSVAFSASGSLLYSAGYDETLCIWQTDNTDAQPSVGAKLNVKAQLDMLDVNTNYDGVLAIAAKLTEGKAVRLITLDENDPSKFSKTNFHSSKAASRSDLNILPTALRFEPSAGELLLAGFGANVHDSGFDTTGDLCLWDIKTQTQLPIHGSNKNVFDIEFNPYRRHMPLFAVGCVAGANVNRGTRSLLRLYDVNRQEKFSCPLEIECKALDMNDVVWCPYDEHLIAAGCTDGRAYVWDMRWPIDPIRTLSHGKSLMPLQDGVKDEVTDTGVRFLSWGDNATRLYSGSSDGVVKVWDVTRSEENTFIKDLVTLDSGIMSGAFSPDRSKLVLGEVNGSINVLEVGRDDCLMRDVERLHYAPYREEEESNKDPDTVKSEQYPPESGVVEGRRLLQTEQLRTMPMGSLPIRQVVQGPSYGGPYDQSVDAPFLREQALDFQLSLTMPSGSQCTIATCKDSFNKITSEEGGDSGRSEDRIPDELRRAWTATDETIRIVAGKSKCTQCGRAARPPSTTGSDGNTAMLCERCSFACIRCGASNPIAPATTTLTCHECTGIWEIGALGYECVQQPTSASKNLHIPPLKAFGEQAYREMLEDMDTAFGDEVNALTDYYHSLAINRPESPPL